MRILPAVIFMALAIVSNLHAATYVVTRTDDDLDPNSLRWAITQANKAGGAIVFQMEDGVPASIYLESPLPALTKKISIDGSDVLDEESEDATAVPVIEVDGSGLDSDSVGFAIKAAGCTLKGLQITGFAGSGVLIDTNISGVTIKGCYIGTDGYGAIGNGTGITIKGKTNVIGGVTAMTADSAPNSAANVISGNLVGIDITGSAATGNSVRGNFIGTDVSGSYAVDNDIGVQITAGAFKNAIGAAGELPSNIISGNDSYGILVNSNVAAGSANTISNNCIGTDLFGGYAIDPHALAGVKVQGSAGTVITGNLISGNAVGIDIGDASAATTVTNNRIGPDAEGFNAIGNDGEGIIITGGSNNVIGGVRVGNVISGNGSTGLLINDGRGDRILGNYIGLTGDGADIIGNYGYGIQVTGSNEQIGSAATAGSGNVISGNALDGIYLLNCVSSGSSTVVARNIIGLDSSGGWPQSNEQSGIRIEGGSGTLVGGAVGARNIISGNYGAGIQILGSSQNTIQNNYIGLDIDGVYVYGNGASEETDSGIVLFSGSNNLIGAVASGTNFICANMGDGIRLIADGDTGDVATGNTVVGNVIGFTAEGDAQPNTLNGIGIYNGASNNKIGDIAKVGNLIGSLNDGIQIGGDDSLGNALRRNSIVNLGSAGIPINLVNENGNEAASDPGDADTGPNTLLNAPVFTVSNDVASTGTTGKVVVTGSYNGASNLPLSLDFYRYDPIADAGPVYFQTLQITTDGSGAAGFNFQLVGSFGGQTISATATDGAGNTSQIFSAVLAETYQFKISGTTSVSESAGSLTLTLTREGDLSGPATVHVVSRDGTALGGVDYGIIDQDVTFQTGSATAQIVIPIINGRPGTTRDFDIVLTEWPDDGVLGAASTAHIVIEDDLAPGGTFALFPVADRVNENAGSVLFQVERTGSLSHDVTLQYTATLATSSTTTVSKPVTIKFAPLVSGTTFSVKIANNTLFEQPDKTLSVTLVQPEKPVPPYKAIISQPTAEVTLCDDDNPNGSIQFTATDFSVDEKVGSIKLALARIGGTADKVTVHYTAINGASMPESGDNEAVSGVDYKPLSGEITFAKKAKSAKLSVPILDDKVFEPGGPKRFHIVLSAPTGGATLAAQDIVDIAISDNDNPDGYFQFAKAALSVKYNAGKATVTVTRTGGTAGPIVVPYEIVEGTAHPGTEYNLPPAPLALTFAKGVKKMNIVIPIIKSTLKHGDASAFSVNLLAPSGDAELGAVQTIPITILKH